MRHIFAIIFSLALFIVGFSNGRFLLVKLLDEDRFQSRIEQVNEEKGNYFYSFKYLVFI